MAPPLVRKWTAFLPHRWTNPLPSYPVIADGKVFVTTGEYQSHCMLWALDLYTGRTLWGPVDIGGHGSWSNAAYDDGRIFTVAGDGEVSAYDADTGELLWYTQVLSWSDAPPTAAHGLVYSGALWAVRQDDGTLAWWSGRTGHRSSPAVSGERVFVSYAGPQAFAFVAATGEPLWHYDSGYWGGGGRTPVVYRGRVYIRDKPTHYEPGTILAADGGGVIGTFKSDPPPAFSGDLGFFLSGAVPPFHTGAALRAEHLGAGTVEWTFTGDGELVTAPIVVSGFVYVGSWPGNLYALNARTGAVAWSTNLGGPNISPPSEHNASVPMTGLGSGGGYLVVPVFLQFGEAFHLAGYGPVSPTATANAESVDFGALAIDKTSDSARIEIRNTGEQPFSLGAPELSGNATSSFQLEAGTCAGFMLAPGAVCELNVTFRPASSGPKTAVVTVPTTASNGAIKVVLKGETDTIAPNTSIVEGPPAEDTADVATFRFASSEAESTFECRLDADPYAVCENPWRTPKLAPGPHRLLVRSVDVAGNRDRTAAQWQWVTVASSPAPPSVSPPPSPSPPASPPPPPISLPPAAPPVLPPPASGVHQSTAAHAPTAGAPVEPSSSAAPSPADQSAAPEAPTTPASEPVAGGRRSAITIRTSRVSVSGAGAARLRLTCSSTARCRGRLELRYSSATLGRATFSIPSGAGRSVTLPLNRAARRLVSAQRTIRTRAVVISAAGRLIASQSVQLTVAGRR